MTTNDIIFHEVFIGRPYEAEVLHDILTNIATLSSRGMVVWEVRCKNGRVRYLLGTHKKSLGRIQEVFKAHCSAQFTKASLREPMQDALKIRISKPVLSLNTSPCCYGRCKIRSRNSGTNLLRGGFRPEVSSQKYA